MRKQFIEAYSWMYGTTKKEAADVYKRVPDNYKRAVINSYNAQCKLSFLSD